MRATNERFPSVPQSVRILRKRTCGTDGMGLKFPIPPYVSGEVNTDTIRTDTDGYGRAKKNGSLLS